MNLAKLLLAQHDESIAVEASQHPLNENEEARFPPAVVTVKNMAVVRVYESAAARRQRDEAVQETGGTSDRSRLCCVRVHDVRPKADHQPPQLPHRQQIARRKLAAHRRNHERRDTVRRREAAHLDFVGGHASRGQERFEPFASERFAQPDDMLRRSADIEPGDEAKHASHGRPAAGATRLRISPSI